MNTTAGAMTPAFLLSQQEIAEQVGCSQQYVAQIKANTTTCNGPSTRVNSLGQTRPTSYAKPKPGQ